MIGMLLGLAAGLVLVHEAGHIAATLRYGGRWQGVVFRGWAVGVRLDVTPLSLRQRLATAWAGPLAEAGAAALLAAVLAWHGADRVTVAAAPAVAAADGLVNLAPWWPANDGARIRAWRRALRAPTAP